MPRTLLLLAALAVAAEASSAAAAALATFDEWRAEHKKEYASEAEVRTRSAAFANNRAFVEAHNSSTSTYTVGLTQFADLTVEEFRSLYLGGSSFSAPPASSSLSSSSSSAPPPPSVDWEAKGLVSPVKNVQCSAVADELSGSIESAAAITLRQPLRAVNESQLAQCTGCGCSGCFVSALCQWATAHGVTYDFAGASCKYKPDLSVRQCVSVKADADAALEAALALTPVVVAVEADSQAFMLYTGGVLGDASCGTAVNHVLLAVGYGTEGASSPYWRARNGWGVSWGEKGYIRLARGIKTVGGQCGILTAPVYPVVAAA
jgi:hypothetical protein